MQHDVDRAIEHLQAAHVASKRANAHLMKCQAVVFSTLDPDTSLEDYTTFVYENFHTFILNPSVEKASDEDFEKSNVVKTFHAPSWTSNEALDEENVKTFGPKKRRMCA
jgi:hypothetical protein